MILTVAIEDGDPSTWQDKREHLEASYTRLLYENDELLKADEDIMSF
jgi:hypothetical protein